MDSLMLPQRSAHLLSWLIAASSLVMMAGGPATAQPLLPRPALMQERLSPASATHDAGPDNDWSRVLLEFGIDRKTPGTQAYHPRSCNYGTALDTLRKMRERPAESAAYQKAWVRNQDLAFSACDSRSSNPTPPQEPAGASRPTRARTDYVYQLGSWHFYRGDFAAALPLFGQVRAARAAPQRPNAAYMVMRTLAHLGRLDEAYAEAEAILADSTLADVHDIAGNYRFVMLSNSSWLAGRGSPVISPALAKKHLRWLHGLQLVNLDPWRNGTHSASDVKDAQEQLAVYFPRQDPESKAVDWWLREESPASPRMQAVKALAPELPLVDWMQASWASNWFDSDWLWALHDPANPYWQQNSRIVAHAWGRWERERDGAWLRVAIERVHPDDTLAGPIRAAAGAYLAHPWSSRPMAAESPEYVAWVYALWENAIRLDLAAGEVRQVVGLVARGPELARRLGYREGLFFPRNTDPSVSYERALRWLIYRGDAEGARQVLAAVLQQYPRGFRKWRSLLATSLAEAHAAGMPSAGFFSEDLASNDPTAWQHMINDLSSQALIAMAEDPGIRLPERALIARTVLARALILGHGNEAVDRAAALAAKLNPSVRELILAGVARHDRADYNRLLLKLPRLRPAVMLEYAQDTTGPRHDPSRALALDAIDVHNPNDNNWWCGFDHAEMQERAFKAARIVPATAALAESESPLRLEIEPYLQRQRELLARHPYRALVDLEEIQALEAVPSGPRFLSESVIARERATPAPQDLSLEERNERAADLHRAVRTTRYGCRNDGTHAEYSREAFTLLRDRYGDTPWARATPYWFR
jgi:hypothetical protein